jgi:hypothetical protein
VKVFFFSREFMLIIYCHPTLNIRISLRFSSIIRMCCLNCFNFGNFPLLCKFRAILRNWKKLRQLRHLQTNKVNLMRWEWKIELTLDCEEERINKMNWNVLSLWWTHRILLIIFTRILETINYYSLWNRLILFA